MYIYLIPIVFLSSTARFMCTVFVVGLLPKLASLILSLRGAALNCNYMALKLLLMNFQLSKDLC